MHHNIRLVQKVNAYYTVLPYALICYAEPKPYATSACTHTFYKTTMVGPHLQADRCNDMQTTVKRLARLIVAQEHTMANIHTKALGLRTDMYLSKTNWPLSANMKELFPTAAEAHGSLQPSRLYAAS